MEETNFKGNLHTVLGDIFTKYPEVPTAHVFYSILHKSNFKGSHFFDMNDERLYASAEKFLKYGDLEDEQCTDEEWEQWRASKFQGA